MNMSLINELRAANNTVRVEMHKIEETRRELDDPYYADDRYARLLTAQANLLNGIAQLVAARGK